MATRMAARRIRVRLQSAPVRLGTSIKDSMVRQMLTYTNIALLAARYGEAGRGLTVSELKVFSQNGEDGVLAEIFRRIGTTNRSFVEFGIGPGLEGNSIFLADILGWNGLFVEGDNRSFRRLQHKYERTPGVTTIHDYLTPNNIRDIFASANVPTEPDLLSIDIDGNDYWLWDAVPTKYAPRAVIVEYNASLDPSQQLVQPYDPNPSFPINDSYGASLGALRSLGTRKGYSFLHCELSGNNAFFVRDDLAHHFSDLSPVDDRRANYWLLGYAHASHTSESGLLRLAD